MSAILFGSISTLADSSEMQCESFNKAFATHHLGWTWSRQDYLGMLDTSGGADRIATYANPVANRSTPQPYTAPNRTSSSATSPLRSFDHAPT